MNISSLRITLSLTICSFLGALCLNAKDLQLKLEELVTSEDSQRITLQRELIELVREELGEDSDRSLASQAESVEILLQATEHENSLVRATACRLFSLVKDPSDKIFERLMEQSQPFSEASESATQGEASEEVRLAALASLGALSPSLSSTEKQRAGSWFLERLNDSELNAQERYALYDGIAKLGYEAAQDTMEKLLTPESSPAYAECALRYLSDLPQGRGLNAILSFLDKKEATSENNEESQPAWPFDERKWGGVRRFAILELLQSGHREGARLLSEELSRSTTSISKLLNLEIQRLAPRYGTTLVQALSEILKDNSKRFAHSPCLDILSALGRQGFDGLVALMDEGIAKVQAAKAEGEDIANPYESFFRNGLIVFAKHEESRTALVEVYQERQNRNDDPVQKEIFEQLLKQQVPEARAVFLEGLASEDSEHVKVSLRAWLQTQGVKELNALEPLIDHSDSDVRKNLAQQLSSGSLPASRTAPLLLRLSEDPDASVRAETWRGLSQGEDPSLIEAFQRGINDPDQEVQFQAAHDLAGLLTPLQVGNKEKRELRNQILEMINGALEKKEGAARGVLERFGLYHNILFRSINDGKDDLIRYAQDFVDQENSSLRAASTRQQALLFNEDWFGRLVQQFLKEEDSTAAEAQLNTLAAHVEELKAHKEDFGGIIKKAIRWLKQADNTENQKYRPAPRAADFLGKFGKEHFTLVNTQLADAIRKALDSAEPGQHSEENRNLIAYGIDAIKRMNNDSKVELVIEVLEKLSSSTIKRHAKSYLETYAKKKDLTRIEELQNLKDFEKSAIRKAVERRSS